MKIKKNWKRWLFFTAVAGLLLYILLGGDSNFYRLLQLKHQRDELRKEIAAEKHKNEELQAQIQKLKSDSTYIEKIAREKYTMGKKGETIYLFKDKVKK